MTALCISIHPGIEEGSAPKGPRVVATGGASRGRSPATRNPWKRCRMTYHAAPEGRRKTSAPKAAVLTIEYRRPYRGGAHQGDNDDHGLELHSTRGYNPLPRWGKEEHSAAILAGSAVR